MIIARKAVGALLFLEEESEATFSSVFEPQSLKNNRKVMFISDAGGEILNSILWNTQEELVYTFIARLIEKEKKHSTYHIITLNKIN